MDNCLTSIELIELTGISRATLNNYISLGILPAPEVGAPPKTMEKTRRVGYFPLSSVEVISRVAELKRQGMMMNDIASRIRSENKDLNTSCDRVVSINSKTDHNPANNSAGTRDAVSVPASKKGMHISLDQFEYPAYLVNPQFQLEWCNDAAKSEIFGETTCFSSDITERSLFYHLLVSEVLNKLDQETFEQFVRDHLSLAKPRLSGTTILSQGQQLSREQSDYLASMYHKVSARPGNAGMVLHSTSQLTKDYRVYVSFFREGIFFSYMPIENEQDSLVDFLSRRDQVIGQLLRKRTPYLTPLAVVIADLQNSTKICAELPPEEYFQLINQVWGNMEPLLRKYRATHGKHAGDGVVYYFLPQPDSNYANNAVEFAREMQQVMKKISMEWQEKKNWLNQLQLNIGIDEGQEWFGTYQTATHLEFTALGDTVNRAGRLSDFAGNGSIWVSKNLISNLTFKDREKIRFGIKRTMPDGGCHLTPATFSRIENLVEPGSAKFAKLQDIAMLAVTEILQD